MYRLPKYLRVFPALALPLLALFQLNCNSSGDLPVSPNEGTFAMSGVVIRDAAINRTTVAARILRNGEHDTSMVVVFAGDTLEFNAAGFIVDSIYSATFGSVNYYTTGSKMLEIFSGDQSISLPIMFLDTFRIDTVTPPTPPGLTGPGIVQMQWFSTPGVDGYVMAATKTNEAYNAQGFSAFAGFAGTQGSLPQAAFFIDTNVTNPQLDTGNWYLSVYGFAGVPDSTLTSKLLPVPMPASLMNNVDTLGVIGTFGTVAVTPYSILHVSTQ